MDILVKFGHRDSFGAICIDCSASHVAVHDFEQFCNLICVVHVCTCLLTSAGLSKSLKFIIKTYRKKKNRFFFFFKRKEQTNQAKKEMSKGKRSMD